jgi:hypothetical protein
MTNSKTDPSRYLNPIGPLAVLAFVLLVGGLLPSRVSAQTPLPVAQAAEFLGKWNVAVQTDLGPFDVVLDIKDSEGSTVANVGSPQGDVSVTDISRSGEQLVLKYGFAGPEGEIPIVVNLSRDGENLKTSMDIGGGLFTASGTGRRAPQ